MKTIVAAIMCGGRGSRMHLRPGIEKPLLQVKGRAIVEYVFDALELSGRFEKIVAAESPNTRQTGRLLQVRGAQVIRTSGEGYHRDLFFLLENLKPAKVFVVPADLPLITSHVIRDILSVFALVSFDAGPSAANKAPSALSVVMDKNFVTSAGIEPSIVLKMGGREYCHSGITVFDTSKIAQGAAVEEQYIVMNRIPIAVNVNTRADLKLAEKYAY